MTKELLTVVLSAIAMGLVLGIFKGVDLIISKYKNGKTSPLATVAQWSDVTGEIRPVTVNECRERHDKLSHDLDRGSTKFADQADTLDNVEKAVLEMKGDMKVGFANIGGEIRRELDTAIDKHERGPLHRTSSYTSRPPKSRG